MRTVFVNPSKPRRRRRRSRRRNVSLAANPRRRRVRRTRRRSRRRNSGIAPFVQSNPMIMSNPRRRRRARNPMGALGHAFNPSRFIKKTMSYGGGALLGAGANILVLRKIENTWLRNGLRVVGAVAEGALLPGDFGAAAAGATLYPLIAEVALMLNLVPAATSDMDETEADLNDLAADLQDVLGQMDTEDNDFEDLIDE